METATKKQERIIKRLGLEKLVPLNISPEKIDGIINDSLLEGKISPDVWTEYFCSDAKRNLSYPVTVLGTLKNILCTYFSNLKTA